MKKQSNRLEPGLIRFAVEGAAFESARSLDLLRIIDDTVRRNRLLSETFERVAHNVCQVAGAVCELTVEQSRVYLDADGSLRSALEKAGDHVAVLIERLREAHASARDDGDLCEDDGVVESFGRAIKALVDAHNAFEELKWAVMEHDADRAPAPTGGPYSDVDDLFAALIG